MSIDKGLYLDCQVHRGDKVHMELFAPHSPMNDECAYRAGVRDWLYITYTAQQDILLE